MEKILDIKNWKRREPFQFYSNYDEPYWGIVSEIDCTFAFEKAKENNSSFFLYYLHKSTMAINKIEEFRYRIRDEQVVEFNKINAAPTLGREDETFGFSFIEYDENFNTFTENASIEIDRIKNTTGLSLNENSERLDVIHYSTLPWTKFTGLTHARNFKDKDSVPKIIFGKYYVVDGKKIMNVSLNAHHGLVDGLHAGKYFELFQKLMNE
ncbi:MAG: chloramphenicol acetyltransferase [Melioribacteraceae bacterium]|nr:chloramphenicol acetyltransferase [Melioribacteraceae bacterium]